MLRCNRGELCDRSVCILHAEQYSRVPIALEELGLEYELKSVNVRQGEQKRPEFLELKLNGKVPVLIRSGDSALVVAGRNGSEHSIGSDLSTLHTITQWVIVIHADRRRDSDIHPSGGEPPQ